MRYEVSDADTAEALGSGDVPVLATPRLIAWMEAAKPPASVSGRRLTFTVDAFDDSGETVAAGEIDRAIVGRERFLESV
jgi:predicted thioesterase